MIVLRYYDFCIFLPKEMEFHFTWTEYELDMDGNVELDPRRWGSTSNFTDIILKTPSFDYIFHRVCHGKYAIDQILDYIHAHIASATVYVELALLPPTPGFRMEGPLEIRRKTAM